jgi:hypothetical protein
MYYVTVTLANGAKVSGVLNARSERHAEAQVRNTVQGRDALRVEAVRSW